MKKSERAALKEASKSPHWGPSPELQTCPGSGMRLLPESKGATETMPALRGWPRGSDSASAGSPPPAPHLRPRASRSPHWAPVLGTEPRDPGTPNSAPHPSHTLALHLSLKTGSLTWPQEAAGWVVAPGFLRGAPQASSPPAQQPAGPALEPSPRGTCRACSPQRQLTLQPLQVPSGSGHEGGASAGPPSPRTVPGASVDGPRCARALV